MMEKNEALTVGQWCERWFAANQSRWNCNTRGGYRNLLSNHIQPSIGGMPLAELTEQKIEAFYDTLCCRGVSAGSVRCVHLLLRRCMDEAAEAREIPYNPVRRCIPPKAEANTSVPLRWGQIRRYLSEAERLGVLPLIYTGLTVGLRQGELLSLSWADFYVRGQSIRKGRRLLTLNSEAAQLLAQIPQTDLPYVFRNPKTGAPYRRHEFYYLHQTILRRAGLPQVAFRELQRRCREVGV